MYQLTRQNTKDAAKKRKQKEKQYKDMLDLSKKIVKELPKDQLNMWLFTKVGKINPEAFAVTPDTLALIKEYKDLEHDFHGIVQLTYISGGKKDSSVDELRDNMKRFDRRQKRANREDL